VPEIKSILKNKSIVILEDCIQATGLSIRGEKVATSGEIVAFSTMYRKILPLVQVVDLFLQQNLKPTEQHSVIQTEENPSGDLT
jgi:dTDP-4-amino-4,6-dideoxygalactose transaminase